MEKAVFLDRDGTIIEDTGYIGQIERVRFIDGVAEAIKLLNDNGYRVIVITNQAGVARGYFTEQAVEAVNGYICDCLAGKGAIIDRFYYCPHHIDGVVEEYRRDCYYRKPNPGMIEQAVSDFALDLKESFLIGDKGSDIEAGRRAGCRTVFITGEPSLKHDEPEADYTAPDLPTAAELLVGTAGWKGTAR